MRSTGPDLDPLPNNVDTWSQMVRKHMLASSDKKTSKKTKRTLQRILKVPFPEEG